MSIDYEKLMTSKSEEGLLPYLEKIELYTDEAVNAALKELQKRGKEFSKQDLLKIELKLEEKKDKRINEEKELRKNSLTKNVVKDENAPAYYSHRAIWLFSTIFTVIFGAILLSSNLKDKGNARWTVLGFGILYTGIALTLLSFLPQNGGFIVAINGVGAWIMTHFFWNKFIGEETKYRTKAIWKPLIISIIITIPFLLAIIYGG